MRLPDLEAWAIFACVVEHHSFSRAAEALGVSKATVSKAVSRLEHSLGTQLFHRTSRRLTLTESGRALADRAARIVAEAQAAEEAARDATAELAGVIRVAAPLTFGRMHVARAVADFLTMHPRVEIDLRLSDAQVDIVADRFDLALRIARLPDSSLRARRIADIPLRLVASPDYIARHGAPRHPAELAERACFPYANTPGAWQFHKGREVAVVRPAGPLVTDNGDAMLPALCAGLGIALLPGFIVDREIAQGRLTALLADWAGDPLALHLVTPPGTLRPARVEALIAFLAARFRNLCEREAAAD